MNHQPLKVPEKNHYPPYILLIRKGVHFLYRLIEPRSKDEDSRRREFILNILLSGSIILSAIVCIFVLSESIKLGTSFRGVSFEISLVIFLVFLGLYFLSRAGFFVVSAYILIAIYFAPTIYATYIWGVDLPTALLTFALMIIMSGILISTKFSIGITVLICGILLSINQLHTSLIIQPKSYWRYEAVKQQNVLVFSSILGVIMIVSWLFNREIKKSLKRARKSEADLQKERDSLEIKVEDRTKDLKKVQLEKVSQLYRLAEFGRLASGMMHDLANPLTIVSLNLEKTHNQCDERLGAIKSNIAKAINATRRIENFITATRKQITNQENKILFSLTEETIQVIQILNYKAKTAKVDIFFSPVGDIQTFGDSIKFSQLISNLISNAIDAYADIPPNRHKREVEVKLYEENGLINLSVRDWGCGIPREYFRKIFTPLFTTKGFDRGTGISLSTVKDIVHKDFKGNIKLGSKVDKGALFIIEFPKVKNIET